MSDRCDQKMQDQIEGGIYHMNEFIKDHVSKKELREWCEEGMKRLNEMRDPMANMMYAMHQTILDKFCKEAQDD